MVCDRSSVAAAAEKTEPACGQRGGSGTAASCCFESTGQDGSATCSTVTNDRWTPARTGSFCSFAARSDCADAAPADHSDGRPGTRSRRCDNRSICSDGPGCIGGCGAADSRDPAACLVRAAGMVRSATGGRTVAAGGSATATASGNGSHAVARVSAVAADPGGQADI